MKHMGAKRKRKRKAEVEAHSGTAKDGEGNKKAYDLPGQKHDRPNDRDPLRIFYETLYEQLPNSDMASVWMMEWGMLPRDEAQKVYERMMKKNKQEKMSLCVNAVSFKTAKLDSPSRTPEVAKILSKSLKKKFKSRNSSSDGVQKADLIPHQKH